MTVADAEEEDFQEALKEAVADKLGVDADDVVVTAVTADGKDGVKITYTVANVDDDAMDAAEGKLESASLASAIEDNLAYEGYKGADVSAATASVTTVEVSQIKAEQLFSGVTTSEAGEEAFQSALTDTVAAGLGLSAKEVSVTAVSEGKKGNVLVTYVITGVQTSAVASAERSIESTNMAEGIQKALHKAGYDDADVVCADVVPSVTDDDKPSKDDDKPSKDDDKPSKDDDKPSKDDDKPSKDDDKKSDDDKPSTDDAATANAIEVSQEISGLTLKEAEDADFQEAFIDAVADALDVDDDDVEIEKVKACGDGCSDPDAVKIVYTVEVGEEDVASAEKTIEKDATAKALKKALKKQGYSVTVAPATAEPTTVAADDDDKPSDNDDKPSKDDDKPSKDDDKKSDDDKPSTDDAATANAIEVSQEISGLTLKEAEDADFQEAFIDAVADALDVDDDDVEIEKVKACGDGCSDPDAVKIVYTVEVGEEDVASAEKTIEKDATAKALKKALKKQGYSVTVAPATAEPTTVTADDDDKPSKDDDKPSKDDDKPSKDDDKKSDDDTPSTVDEKAIEVSQEISGVTLKEAEDADFQEAIKKAVAAKLGVAEDDVVIDKVKACGDSCSDPDAVKVVYTVLGVCEDLMSALPVKPSAATVASWQLAQCDAEIAAAEKKLESASLASAIEDNLAEAGYKGADVSKADTEEITVDPDDFTPSPTSKPTKVRACASLRMRIAPPRLNVTHTAFVQAPDDDVVLPAPGDKVEVVQTFEGISATAAKSTKFKAALAEVVGMILGVNSADVEVNKVTMQGGLDAVVTYSVADNYGLNKSAMKTLLSAKGKEIETALMDRGFVAGAGHMTTSLVKGSSSISAGIKSSSKGKKASSKTRFLRHAA